MMNILVHSRPKGNSVWLFLTILALFTAVGCTSDSSELTATRPTEAASPPALTTSTPTAANTAPATQQLSIATHTPTPFPTDTSTPSSTPTPTNIPSPSPTPTPLLRQLTTGGCCTQPFWSPDSRWVIFIDKPSPDTPVGFWGMDTDENNPTPQLQTERIAFYTSDLSYIIDYDNGQTAIERLAGPLSQQVIDTWTIPAEGRPVSISPNRTQVAWSVSNDNALPEFRVSEVWVANLDGTEPRSLTRLSRGGFAGWITDERLLLSGRESLDSRETVLYTYSLTDDSMVELLRAERPRGFELSPDGRWLAYYVAFSDELAENGLWLLHLDSGERRLLDRELFGSYAWRDALHLLIIPFHPDAQFHELWEVDVETGQVRQLTDPTVTQFKVANGDWQVSPDGRHVVFVESTDKNIWLLTLAD